MSAVRGVVCTDRSPRKLILVAVRVWQAARWWVANNQERKVQWRLVSMGKGRWWGGVASKVVSEWC